MDKNKKPFKLGQLITINNRIYRVTTGECLICMSRDFCGITLCRPKIPPLYLQRIPPGCYFKLVK